MQVLPECRSLQKGAAASSSIQTQQTQGIAMGEFREALFVHHLGHIMLGWMWAGVHEFPQLQLGRIESETGELAVDSRTV
jgi:hypothetical protein